MLAPIVLFTYNRPWHTEQTLLALELNHLAQESVLYIYSDGPKDNASPEDLNKIKETRAVLRKKQWCKEVHIIESQKNKGLANSIIDGVTYIVNKYDRIIVLEDDLLTTKGFLKYMNDGLDKYENEPHVVQISGHCFPAHNIPRKTSSFFLPITTSWGWATWKTAWKKFDKNATGYEALKHDKNLEREFNINNIYPLSKMLFEQMESQTLDSWAIRWWWSVFKEKGLILFPDRSMIKNIGFGTEGTHTHGVDPFFLKDFDQNYFISDFPANTIVDKKYFEEIKTTIKNSTDTFLYKKKKPSFLRKIINKLNRGSVNKNL